MRSTETYKTRRCIKCGQAKHLNMFYKHTPDVCCRCYGEDNCTADPDTCCHVFIPHYGKVWVEQGKVKAHRDGQVCANLCGEFIDI